MVVCCIVKDRKSNFIHFLELHWIILKAGTVFMCMLPAFSEMFDTVDKKSLDSPIQPSDHQTTLRAISPGLLRICKYNIQIKRMRGRQCTFCFLEPHTYLVFFLSYGSLLLSLLLVPLLSILLKLDWALGSVLDNIFFTHSHSDLIYFMAFNITCSLVIPSPSQHFHLEV